jgi:hypothetical protein
MPCRKGCNTPNKVGAGISTWKVLGLLHPAVQVGMWRTPTWLSNSAAVRTIFFPEAENPNSRPASGRYTSRDESAWNLHSALSGASKSGQLRESHCVSVKMGRLNPGQSQQGRVWAAWDKSNRTAGCWDDWCRGFTQERRNPAIEILRHLGREAEMSPSQNATPKKAGRVWAVS